MDAPGFVSRITENPDATAIVAHDGTWSFGELTEAAGRVAAALLRDKADLDEGRVAFLLPPGCRYSAVLLGTWAAGGVAVPLATSHPAPELEFVVEDVDASVIVASDEYGARLGPIAAERGIEMIDADRIVSGSDVREPLPPLDSHRRALILYTSGSTGPPKGVVWRHRNIEAQLRILSEAWRWEPQDRSLLVLPLHHIHGLINVLSCALWNGATCEVLQGFNAITTLERLASGDVSVFMAVPTIYRRLIAAWEGLDEVAQRRTSASLSRLRLMVSGSAALPIATLDRWREISGHTLLERYGMTEIGMALSNRYDGAGVPGAVGTPLPTVKIRLVDDGGRPVGHGEQGQIELKGPSVFGEYWKRPRATSEAFRDGWFRTGDVAVVADDVYRIVGRQSVDIIKSGGEKVSALEVEDVMRTHPGVLDCAVVGVEDAEWGERVALVVVPATDQAPDLEELQAFARQTLAAPKLPRLLVVLDDLPRNALGKVVKPMLKELFR